jgi:uncharacterized protein (DUF2249 family)
MTHTCNHTFPEAIYPFDARGVAKRFRHAAIFGALDSLTLGETMRFVNDHDPIPLLNQLQARYGAAVKITYLQREPGVVIDFIKQGISPSIMGKWTLPNKPESLLPHERS